MFPVAMLLKSKYTWYVAAGLAVSVGVLIWSNLQYKRGYDAGVAYQIADEKARREIEARVIDERVTAVNSAASQAASRVVVARETTSIRVKRVLQKPAAPLLNEEKTGVSDEFISRWNELSGGKP